MSNQDGQLQSESLVPVFPCPTSPNALLNAPEMTESEKISRSQSEHSAGDVDLGRSQIPDPKAASEVQRRKAPTEGSVNVPAKSDMEQQNENSLKRRSFEVQLDGLETDTLTPAIDGNAKIAYEDFSAKPKALDGGWGWAVLIGAFYIVAFMINITICFGILFSSRIQDLNITSAQVSYVFMLHNILYNFGILLTNTLAMKFGYRKVSFIGCLTGSVSFMLLAFANSLTFIIIVYSIIVPVSGAIGSTVSFLIVPLYFERRRGLAMAIMMTGIAAGGIVCPLLIRYLQDNYGFFWATLIQGAIILNCCVGAALFRSPPTKRKQRSSPELKVNSLFVSNEKELADLAISPKRKSPKATLHERLLDFTRPLITWMRQNYLVLKNRKVLMIGFGLSTAMVGYFNFLMLVPFAVESAGHTPQFSARCVSASNFANAGIRLLVSAVADRSWFNRTFCFGTGMFIAALTTLAFIFVNHSEPLMIFFIVGFGLGIGLYMSLYHMHMIDVLGMELYSAAVGVNAIIMAFTFALSGPLFGCIRRLSTSYGYSLGACSLLLLCSTLLVVKLHTRPIRCKRIPS